MFVLRAAFDTILGEEFHFRGVLLPRTDVVSDLVHPPMRGSAHVICPPFA